MTDANQRRIRDLEQRLRQQQQRQNGQSPTSPLSMPSTFSQVLILTALAALYYNNVLPEAVPADWHAYVNGLAIAVAGFFGISLATRLVHPYHHIEQVIRSYRVSQAHGSARFANDNDIRAAGLHKDRGLWIGQFGKIPLRFENETHTLVLSPAGGGKTVYLVMPQLALVEMPMLVTDMKGELTAVTARWRQERMGHRVRVLNPPPSWPHPTDSYNPCDLVVEALLTQPRDAMENAKGMAFQLLPEPQRSDGNRHFRDGSRDIITFIITALAVDAPHLCSLPMAHSIVANPDSFRGLADKFKDSQELNGVLADEATNYLAKFETRTREFESMITGAKQALGPFNAAGRIAELCRTSTFRFREMQTGDENGRLVTIYNCCDQSRAAQFKSWIGLLNWAAMTELQRTPRQRQVMILLDEAGNFVIPEMPGSLTALRGYGVSVFMVFQEHAQIENVYGKPASETIWGQSALRIAFGINSLDTAKRLSEMAGERTIETVSAGNHSPGDTMRINTSHTRRPLLTPNEVQTLDPDRMMVFVKNLPVIMATRCGYHEMEPMRSGLDPNPFHGNVPYLGRVRLLM